jgi:hypothetical protein
MILNSPIISGSLTVTGNIITSGSITISGSIASASYASNADLLDGLDSTVFTLTSSFAAQTASFNAFSASHNTFTASLNAFSASVLTFTGSASTRLGALESYTSSLNAKTASFATTGSNAFIGTQTITGSVLQSGSFTSTGTLTAQTLVVQTITSSVVYSSGSNIFGNALNNTQTFTGSVLVTGSLTIAGGSSATSYSGATIYGSTAVCSPVGKFTTCLDLGGALTGTSATFSSTVIACNTSTFSNASGLSAIFSNGGGSSNFNSIELRGGTVGSAVNWQISKDNTLGNGFEIAASTTAGGTTYASPVFKILNTGAATFSSTITGTTIYGSTAVCSPSFISSGTICSTGNTCFGGMNIINNCLGIGTATPQFKLDIQNGSLGIYHNTSVGGGNGGAQLYLGDMNFAGGGYACSAPGIGAVCSPSAAGVAGDLAFFTYTGIIACRTERMRIAGGNVGIGTTSPAYKLDVVGDINSSTNISSATGLFSGNKTVTISALNTAYQFAPVASGIVTARDNTNGGSGIWLMDPNGNSGNGQLIQYSWVNGTYIIYYYPGGTYVQKTSGNVPVTLQFAILQQ